VADDYFYPNTAIKVTRDWLEKISMYRVEKGCLKQLSFFFYRIPMQKNDIFLLLLIGFAFASVQIWCLGQSLAQNHLNQSEVHLWSSFWEIISMEIFSFLMNLGPSNQRIRFKWERYLKTWTDSSRAHSTSHTAIFGT
jgi:hypothetical protein